MDGLSTIAHQILARWDRRPKASLSLLKDIALPVFDNASGNIVSGVNELVAAGLIQLDDRRSQASLVRSREFWTIAVEDVEQDAEVNFGTPSTAWTARLLRSSRIVTHPEGRLICRLDGTPEGEYGPEALSILQGIPQPRKRPDGFITDGEIVD